MQKTIITALAAALIGTAAHAVPVQLSFSGTATTFSSLPAGASVGDTITMTVIADNGGTGLISQSWQYTDVVSSSISVGTYSATTSGAVLGGWGSFSTDATGMLSSLSLNDVRQTGVDTAGETIFEFYMNAGNDVWFPGAGVAPSIGAASPPSVANTSISLVPSAVPLPASAILLVGALGGLSILRRRRT